MLLKWFEHVKMTSKKTDMARMIGMECKFHDACHRCMHRTNE